MKRFTHKNEGFTCENCGSVVPDAHQTCRNHCTQCLYSKHVDVNPGDRSANCGGLMRPVSYEVKSGLPVRIIHVCTVCGFTRPNKIADDDNRETIFALSV